jgi:hypothetical protein
MAIKQALERVSALADLPGIAFELAFEAAWHPFDGAGFGPLVVVGRRSGFLALGRETADPPREARRVARWVTGRGLSAVVFALDPARRLLAISVTGHELPVATVALGAVRTLDERILERARAVRHESPLAAAVAWADALAGQSLGERFFEQFRRTLDTMGGALPRAIPARDRHALGLLSLTRVLFLYFVQERGWLDGRPHFLREELDRCLAGSGGVERVFLHPLFFGTLNRGPAARSKATRRFGRIPFLNGGLFEPHRLEAKWSPRLADEVWRDAFDRLFERYHFTIAEDDPCRSSIGPDMLGRVFERVMDPELRRDSGAFYTPTALVDRLVDRALISWLAGQLGGSAEAARERLEQGDPTAGARIAGITVLDPAVGSGAFLLGALKWLVTARQKCGQAAGPATRAVVRQNLFGIDRNANAVRLAELRLWLAVIQADSSEAPEDVAPLPNLDALVRQGDSVIDPVHLPFVVTGGEGPPLASFRQAVVEANGPAKRRTLDALRRAEVRAARAGVNRAVAITEGRIREILGLGRVPSLFGTRHPLSRALRGQLILLRRERAKLRSLDRRLATADEVPWFHFATHFADVIEAGGFDLVIGNPPWVRAEQLPPMIRASLKARYRWFRGGATARGYRHLPDLSVAFVERALELVRPDGVVAYLLPAKLLTAQYAATAREALARTTTLDLVAELENGGDGGFDAMVYPLAVVARRRAPAADHLVATGFDDGAPRVPQGELGAAPWRHASTAMTPLLEAAARHSTLGDRYPCRLGVKTGADRIFLDPPEEIGDRWVRPALKGRDLEPFAATPSARLLWTHDAAGVALAEVPPRVASHLHQHRTGLARRSDYRGGPIGMVFRVEAAIARHRVAWPDLARELAAVALIGPLAGTIPLNTCYVLAAEDDAAALSIAAWLNSRWIRAIARHRATVAGSRFRRFDTATVSGLPLPALVPGDAVLRRLAAEAQRSGAIDQTAIDRRAAELLGLDPAQVPPP